MEQVDGWAPDVPMALAGPFLESMRFVEWLQGLLFRCPSLLVPPLEDMDTAPAIMGEDATEPVSMASRILFRPAGRGGAWFQTEPRRNESPMKPGVGFRFLLQGFIALFMTGSAFSGDVIAVMKSPSVVYRLNASNGAFLGQINPSGGVQSVGCDGETIAVLSNSGTISRYSADTGAFLGQIQPAGRCTDVQVSGGVIIARSAHTASRYSARTGAFLGQS